MVTACTVLLSLYMPIILLNINLLKILFIFYMQFSRAFKISKSFKFQGKRQIFWTIFTLAHDYVPSWIHPGAIVLNDIHFQTIESAHSLNLFCDSGRKRSKWNGANISLYTVVIYLIRIAWTNYTPIIIYYKNAANESYVANCSVDEIYTITAHYTTRFI